MRFNPRKILSHCSDQKTPTKPHFSPKTAQKILCNCTETAPISHKLKKVTHTLDRCSTPEYVYSVGGVTHLENRKNTTMKTHTEYLDYIESTRDYIICQTLKREDADELVWQHADCSEHVIYYSKAHDLVHLVRNWDSSLYNEAQDEVEELNGGEFLDYDTYATRLAFSIIRIHLSQLVNEFIDQSDKLQAEAVA